ncbi:Ribonuclease II, putative isoform 1 [Hibiscus syriacus]|uniref:RHOMBOID-like protein n=1 Tax=Hibiscus syriacus TaxID=106335 RepID=A0A6A3BR08_HIBSY|nr:RHOMBOID-like protein 4 [Hibiscus syriacus]XP_039068067.1 RHOMBOID-like protein 4 [Hibiscus syriacus]KAE8717319.1 Ribonuclease II, putative isoform 1 [Hibiscus syriacus]
MATDTSSRIPTRANSRRSGSSIHPVDVETPPVTSPAPIVYREIKHFKKWISWLIPAFVFANTVVFIITMYVNNCPKKSAFCIADFLGRFSFQPFRENPLLGPSSVTLRNMGALDVNKVVHGDQGWRLITCNWLHGGVFHLLANMLSLLVIGIRLEREFGFILVGLLYIISGFGGSLMSALFLQSNISVGASGALFGLLGSMLSELITNWTIYANKVASFLTLVIIIAVNLAVGILPHVDNFAHIGGFLTGFLLGFVFFVRPQFEWGSQQYAPPGYSASPRPKFKKYQCILWVVSLILVIVGLTLGLVMLLRGVDANDHCSWCHYLSCVPTSRWRCNTEPAFCTSTQLGSQVNVTCSPTGKTTTYFLPGASSSMIQSLCSRQCH